MAAPAHKKRNPRSQRGPFGEAYQAVTRTTGPLTKPIDDAWDAVTGVGSMADRKLGKVLRGNPRPAYYIISDKGNGNHGFKAGPYRSLAQAKVSHYWTPNDAILTYKQVLKLERDGRLEKGVNQDWSGWKRNPASDAASMYESFHGAPSTETLEFHDDEHYHGNLAALGVLVEMKVETVTGLEATLGFSTEGGDSAENPKRRPTDVDGKPVPQNYEMLSIRRNSGDALDVKNALAGEGIPAVVVEPPNTTFGQSTGNWSVWTAKKTYKRAVKLAEKAYFDRYPEKLRNPDDVEEDSGKDCIDCGNRIEWLADFPGPRCLNCHARKMEGQPLGRPDFVGALGFRKGRRRKNPDPISFSTVLLCSNEDGTQLYLVGGDQALDLAALKMDGDKFQKDKIVIGDVVEITYRTKKEFDQFKEIDYFHHFSEDSKGPLPELVYDRLNESLELVGGSYKINQPLLGVSPGIED